MNVYQLIYGKLPPGEVSCWGKKDYHTLFYPIDVLNRNQILDFESRIHRPTVVAFTSKLSVFFPRILDQDYLAISQLKNLPDARDDFGRSGIFMVQTFLFPPELWRTSVSLLALFTLVGEYLFPDQTAVLASPRIHRDSGNIEPVSIAANALANLPRTLPPLTTVLQKNAVLLLNRWATDKTSPFPLLIKSQPDMVAAWLDAVSAYVPNALKPRLGWDAAFDGGRFMHYPLRIAGATQLPPQDSDPFTIDLSTQTWSSRADHAAYLQPQTPFQRWLCDCPDGSTTQARLEDAYQLSIALTEDTPLQVGNLESWDCFVNANKDTVSERFSNKSRDLFGGPLAQRIEPRLSIPDQFRLLLDGMPLEEFLEMVESILFKERLPLKQISPKILADLGTAGSPGLQLLAKVARGEPLDHDALQTLDSTVREELIVYLLLNTDIKPWLIQILKKDEALFEVCSNIAETKPILRKLLLDIICHNKAYSNISDIILDAALHRRQGFAVLQGAINFLELVEGYLKRGTADAKAMGKLVEWAKQRDQLAETFPYIHAFLYPQQTIPSEVRDNPVNRDKLPRCLIEFHDLNLEDLKDMGFSEDVLDRLAEEQEKQKKRFWSRVKTCVKAPFRSFKWRS